MATKQEIEKLGWTLTESVRKDTNHWIATAEKEGHGQLEGKMVTYGKNEATEESALEVLLGVIKRYEASQRVGSGR